MSDKLYISVPVNIARNTIVELRKICPEAEVFNSSKRFYQDDMLFLEKIKEGKMDEVPDLIVSIRPEIQWALDDLKALDVFDTDFRYPLRKGLTEQPLFDEEWLLKPIFVMPLVMFCSKDLKAPPTSWQELMEPRFKGKVITTDIATPPAALVRRQFCHSFGQQGERFIAENVAYRGLPIDVNKAVTTKEYDVGIMPLSFAAFSKDNSTRVCWPQEGALPLTQIMLMKKGYSPACEKAAQYLTSQLMQETFSRGASFIPVHPDVVLPKAYIENDQSLFWNGRDDFMTMGQSEPFLSDTQ